VRICILDFDKQKTFIYYLDKMKSINNIPYNNKYSLPYDTIVQTGHKDIHSGSGMTRAFRLPFNLYEITNRTGCYDGDF
jgi:hypothetical protein